MRYPVASTIPIIRPVFDHAELDNLRRCLESGHVTQGPFTAEFERRFAARHDAAHALAVTSCTTALHLALAGLGIGPGDEVIVPALSWVATANAVEYLGATPIFVDILPDTYTIDPIAVARAVTPRTRAIIAVHLFGLCADMDPLRRLGAAHDLFVVEDAACAAGSRYKGRSAGILGHVACFSFHPRKVITTGEGGMITTSNAALAGRMAILRSHGTSPMPAGSPPWAMPEVDVCGFNFRLSDIQSAVGCAQMDKMDAILAERAHIADLYTAALAPGAVATPIVPPDYVHSWQSYVVRFGSSKTRNAAARRLADAGIQSRPGTHAIHRLGYYARKYHLAPEDFPAAARAEDLSLALPVVHGMSDADISNVVQYL